MSMIAGLVSCMLGGQLVGVMPEFGVLTDLVGKWSGPLRFDESVGAEEGMVMNLEISKVVGDAYMKIEMNYRMMGRRVDGLQMVGFEKGAGKYWAWGFTNSPSEYPEPRREGVVLERDQAGFNGEMMGQAYTVSLRKLKDGKLEHVTQFGGSEVARAVLSRVKG